MGWGLNADLQHQGREKDVVHLGVVYGEGIASYMNDGGTDMGPELMPPASRRRSSAPRRRPARCAATSLPLLGLTAYYDHYWNDQWSSSIGWSMTKVDNTDFQEAVGLSDGPVRLGQHPLHARPPHPDGRRAAVGRARGLRRQQGRRPADPGVVQIQLLEQRLSAN
jgi:hypothetical protein